jgi:hypothetical protein
LNDTYLERNQIFDLLAPPLSALTHPKHSPGESPLWKLLISVLINALRTQILIFLTF